MVKNERGIVLTVLLLIMLPLFVWSYICSVEQAQTTYQVDIDVQQALEDATRGAAMCMNVQAQANAKPMIDCDRANAIFRSVLATNLSLDPNTLDPLTNSGLKEAPQYVLAVYNGIDNTYGVDPARKYSTYNSGSTYSYNNLNPFPTAFYINDDDISTSSGTIVTNLNAPGCVAVIKASFKPFATNEYTGTRWAAAQIHWSN